MKTVLICHEGAKMTQEGLARWLASFSDLAGIVVIQEERARKMKRLKREIERTGLLRFLDVAAFKLFYKLRLAKADKEISENILAGLKRKYPAIPESTRILKTGSPNSKESETFIKELAPDIMLARCKTLLAKRVFSIPSKGTFVMHPGICPEYRNSHGCFWALANNDTANVGMTLLKIDAGVDTGPVYGFYSYPYDEVNESHITIQTRVVTDNLEAIKEKLLEIDQGRAQPIDIAGRSSAAWGQPWLTKYLRWKRNAKKRHK